MAHDDYPPIEQDDEERRRLLAVKGGAPPVITAGANATPRVTDEMDRFQPVTWSGGSMPPVRPPRPYASPEPPEIGGMPPVTANLPEAAPPVRPVGPAEQRLTSLTAQGAPPVTPLHGWKRALDVVGQIAAPRVEQAIRYGPQSAYEGNLARAQKDYETELEPEKATAARQKEQGAEALQGAQTEEAKARAESLRNPPEKQGLTPEETTIHDLMTGENGGPRVNPDTGKPYTYLEAYTSMKQAAQSAKPEKTPSEEQAFITQYLKDNRLPDTAANRLKGHQAWTVKPQDTADKRTARSDKSFQYNQGALDKVRTPIDALAQRFSRLTDTLAQASPQADALVAPELLSVMAGGQGSGVRMNEAEIARIVGGRSAWETLKAAMQHWSTNPQDARSITADQDAQIRGLIQAVGQKVSAKQRAIEEAQNALLDSDDPKDHRRIVADARKKLDDIDAGTAGAGGGGGETTKMYRGGKEYDIPKGQEAAFEKSGGSRTK